MPLSEIIVNQEQDRVVRLNTKIAIVFFHHFKCCFKIVEVILIMIVTDQCNWPKIKQSTTLEAFIIIFSTQQERKAKMMKREDKKKIKRNLWKTHFYRWLFWQIQNEQKKVIVLLGRFSKESQLSSFLSWKKAFPLTSI